jgi:hypothetical protein
LWTLCALLLTTTHAWAQGSTTGTIRGTIQDPTGGVLPGATVTLINEGTKATQVAVSDGRQCIGSICGTYDMGSGFIQVVRQTAIAISPADNRGIDVRLEVGQQSETVTVTSQVEIVQTETGAREGIITAKQIENLSVIGRSALELMRILPGVVTEFNQGESVSFGGGAQTTQGYTVNGIRSSGNTVSLDGSSLSTSAATAASSSPEQRDGSGVKVPELELCAASAGTGGMNVSGVTKSGRRGSGLAVRLLAPHKFAANDRRTASRSPPKPKSTYQYPGGNIGGLITFGDNYQNRDRLFFFVAFERSCRTSIRDRFARTSGDEERRLRRAAPNRDRCCEHGIRSSASAGLPEHRASRRRTTTCGRT